MPFAKVHPCIRELMKKAADDPDSYGWLQQIHKDGFIKRCREAEKLVGDIKAELPLDDPGQSLGELALAEPLKYKTRKGEEVTVYLVGTDHDTRDTAKQIREVAEKVQPDYICAEHPQDWEQKFTDTMTELWVDFDGDVEAMAAGADQKNGDDKEYLTNMRTVGHIFRNDKYTDQIVEWGTFLSVDVGMCALMAHKLKCPLKWIDIPEYAHDKKFGPVWDHVAMHVCLKKVFGIDCLEEDLKIEQIYQLAAAAELQPVHVMRADQGIEATIAPGIHTLGTHTRDLYMQWKIQQICENNPGKTILAVMGAFHSLNIRDMWQYRIPQSLAQCVESQQTTRKQMHKRFREYGGRMLDPCREADVTRFPKW